MTDGQWHSVTVVADRQNHRLAIYVDGFARAFADEPPDFGDMGDESDGWFSVGEEDYRDTANTGPWAFPGVLDEVRVSSTAHAPDSIHEVFLGLEGPLAFTVSSARPAVGMRGSDVEIILFGYHLYQLEATLVDGSGVGHACAVAPQQCHRSACARFNPRLGDARPCEPWKWIHRLAPVTLPFRILDSERSLLRNEPDTLLLWHLDEPEGGRSTAVDSGPLSIHGKGDDSYAESLPAMFGRARTEVSGPTGKSFDFSTSSFTVEGWVNNGRTTHWHDQDFLSQFFQSGAVWFETDSDQLEVSLKDAAGKFASLVVPAQSYDESRNEWVKATVSDGEWHYVALVVDRAVGEMRLYLDGEQRGVRPLPADFGALYFFGPNGSFSLDGLWDELRISSSAHTSEKIWEDFCGEHPYQVTSVSPRVIHPSRRRRSLSSLKARISASSAVASSKGLRRPTRAWRSVSGLYGRVVVAVTPGSVLRPGRGPAGHFQPGSPDMSCGSGDRRAVASSRLPPTPSYCGVSTRVRMGLSRSRIPVPTTSQGTAASQSKAVTGRFTRGRELASISSGLDGGRLQFDASSFSVSFWMKSDGVSDTYTLVARESSTAVTEFDVALLATGGIRARVYDASRRVVAGRDATGRVPRAGRLVRLCGRRRGLAPGFGRR